ncbi:MAG TPA: CDP-alcohol phosphatidyltransferase family protein [Nevskia sp.]|nr:CDP-alcohol phosphatidyltransferase family protein [Nevskia sp.]
MNTTTSIVPPAPERPWDARLARRLITPLIHTRVTPNHLTTVRLLVGVAAIAAFLPGSYGWSNIAALLFVLSNFLDHTDGELARLSGKTSRIGHIYDLASDALIHIALFAAIGYGLRDSQLGYWATPLGLVAGCAVSLIFWMRMVIEERLGKAGTKLASVGGFETEDVLYLMPLVSLSGALQPFLLAAAVGAPLYALWVTAEFLRSGRPPVNHGRPCQH